MDRDQIEKFHEALSDKDAIVPWRILCEIERSIKENDDEMTIDLISKVAMTSLNHSDPNIIHEGCRIVKVLAHEGHPRPEFLPRLQLLLVHNNVPVAAASCAAIFSTTKKMAMNSMEYLEPISQIISSGRSEDGERAINILSAAVDDEEEPDDISYYLLLLKILEGDFNHSIKSDAIQLIPDKPDISEWVDPLHLFNILIAYLKEAERERIIPKGFGMLNDLIRSDMIGLSTLRDSGLLEIVVESNELGYDHGELICMGALATRGIFDTSSLVAVDHYLEEATSSDVDYPDFLADHVSYLIDLAKSGIDCSSSLGLLEKLKGRFEGDEVDGRIGTAIGLIRKNSDG